MYSHVHPQVHSSLEELEAQEQQSLLFGQSELMPSPSEVEQQMQQQQQQLHELRPGLQQGVRLELQMNFPSAYSHVSQHDAFC